MNRTTVVQFGERELAALNARADASLWENAWEAAVEEADECADLCQSQRRISMPSEVEWEVE